MTKGKKKTSQVCFTSSYYTLSEVIEKINNGQFLINSNAARLAFQDFGWEISDIVKAYRKLQPKHFYKSDNSRSKPGLVIDVYKAYLFGENIYTHFYIDDTIKKLVINSFHKLS